VTETNTQVCVTGSVLNLLAAVKSLSRSGGQAAVLVEDAAADQPFQVILVHMQENVYVYVQQIIFADLLVEPAEILLDTVEEILNQFKYAGQVAPQMLYSGAEVIDK